jgi:hypothetical protein
MFICCITQEDGAQDHQASAELQLQGLVHTGKNLLGLKFCMDCAVLCFTATAIATAGAHNMAHFGMQALQKCGCEQYSHPTAPPACAPLPLTCPIAPAALPAAAPATQNQQALHLLPMTKGNGCVQAPGCKPQRVHGQTQKGVAALL